MNDEIEDALIIAYLNGNDLTDAQNESIALWLQKPENKLIAIDIYQAWELAAIADEGVVNTDLYWDKIERIIDIREERSDKPKWKWWISAALILLIFGTFFGVYVWTTNQSSKIVKLEKIEGNEEFILPDNSKVTLNDDASLTYKESQFISSATKRIITLKGKAYFDVKSEEERPFIIQTHDAEIKVVGTRFYVSTNEKQGTTVSLIEGSVIVNYHNSNKTYVLKKNEKIEANQHEVTKVLVNDLFWKTKTLNFEKTSLKHVFNVLSEKYNTSFNLENSSIEDCQLTSQFKDLELEEIIEILQSIYSIRIIEEDSLFMVTGDGCN